MSAAVDGGHALVAVDAQRPGLGIGLDAAEEIGLAQQGAGHGDEREALGHGQVHSLLAGDPAEQDQLWLGDPGVGAPRGPYLALMRFMLRPFVAAGYSVWIAAQRPDIAVGYTVADMAEDCAGVIAEEFGGKVDLVIGHSGAGMIGFCLAARHAGRFGHIVIAAAPYTMTEQAKVANRDSARLMSQGRKTEGAAVLVNLFYPGIPAAVARVPAAIVARVGFAAVDIGSDFTIGADAVNAFDGRAILPEISVPVLMVCGDRDRWTPKEDYEETARLIPDCTLKLYPGKDHLGAMFSRRFPQDVLDFVRQHPHVQA